MQSEIPRALLQAAMAEYRTRPYGELTALIGHVTVRTTSGSDGRDYQIEIEAMWNDQPGGAIRVLGAIDDGSFRTFLPLSEDFIMGPNGELLGEV